jgi:hypothetical protein
MFNDEYWDGWDSQHFNEYEFDESHEISMIFKMAALTEKLSTKLQVSLNSQKTPEEKTQEVCINYSILYLMLVSFSHLDQRTA